MDHTPQGNIANNTNNKHTPEQEAFIARMSAINDRLKTNGSTLRELYDTGQTDQLEEQLQDMAISLMQEDEEYKLNMAWLRGNGVANTVKPGTGAEIVARNKDLLSLYKGIVAMESGLPNEASLNALEKSKKNVGDFLKSQGYEGGDPAEALSMLGIIREDGDAIAYSFPTDLVPEETNHKWYTYLASVIKHVNTEKDLQAGKGTQQAVMEADRTRTYAHNAVTGDVHNILGLQDDEGWAFKDTRQLIANIRDQTLPDEASLSSSEAQELYKKYEREFKVSAVLSEKSHS